MRIESDPADFINGLLRQIRLELLASARHRLVRVITDGELEYTYSSLVKRFIYFHRLRHPAEIAEHEINAFLMHLAIEDKVSASTQNQAFSALLFLYRHVLAQEIGDLGEVIRARKPKRLPVVVKCEEAKAI